MIHKQQKHSTMNNIHEAHTLKCVKNNNVMQQSLQTWHTLIVSSADPLNSKSPDDASAQTEFYTTKSKFNKYYKIWEDRGYFEIDGNKSIQEDGKNFAIMMPPPN